MELTINYLEKKKSRFRIVFGIITFLFSIFLISFILGKDEDIRMFEWLQFALFFILGIGHLIEGSGLSMLEIFGAKSYVKINSDRISIKPEVFKQEEIVKWEEIKDFEYKSAQYKITRDNDSFHIFDLPTNNYNKAQTIKETIKSLANERGINISE
ncbi:MAG: hypothetical protein ACFCUU_05355 [Cyclobacteriaceae bacterium]